MFRAERPQAGRYREFWQIGAESFGNTAPSADAELLLMVQQLFQSLGVPEVELKINNLGCEICRPIYRQALADFLAKERSGLCDDCQRRIDKNPLRALDCKIDGPRLSNWPTVDQYWCENTKKHFAQVSDYLTRAKSRFIHVPRLVRGLDYYTGTVFEVTATVLGAQNAIAAGGRYDGLVKEVGGPQMPALGFALGLERTVETLKKISTNSLLDQSTRIFVAALGVKAIPEAFALMQQLRSDVRLVEKSFIIDGGFFEKKIGSQLTMADRWKATYCLILGEEEVSTQQVTLKNLKKSTQERLAKDRLITYLLDQTNA